MTQKQLLEELKNQAEKIDNPNEPGPLQTDCEWGELTPLPNNRVLTQEEIEKINKVKLPF